MSIPPVRISNASAPAGVAVGTVGTVLLVEDNADVAASTMAVLESFGWTVRHAADAETALELLDSGGVSPDVVLADIAMPGEFDGAELAVHLRSTRPQLRVVLMTGRITEVHRVSSDFALLPKPCAPSELVAALTGRR